MDNRDSYEGARKLAAELLGRGDIIERLRWFGELQEKDAPNIAFDLRLMSVADKMEILARALTEQSPPEHGDGWINLKDRVPQDGDWVLVFAGAQEWKMRTVCRYHTGWLSGFTKGPGFVDPTGGQIFDVTHWMLFPQSPATNDFANGGKNG